MKIAVYTIALNEEQFAARWARSCERADYRVVADTGSTDRTAEILREHGVSVYPVSVKPWRFDRARDASLLLVPGDADLCVCLDLDEVLTPGWRETIERAWAQTPGLNRLRYTHIWSWKDGKPDLIVMQDRIHGRHTHQWKFPAHECACIMTGQNEVRAEIPDVLVEHHPDPNKSRAGYLSLLALGAQEYPNEPRMAHYYGRELMYRGKHREAIAELHRHLAIPNSWYVERAQSMQYIGRCHANLREFPLAEKWLVAAATECADWREPWVDLAQVLHEQKDWIGGMWAAERALAITTPTTDIGRTASAWGAAPWDLLSCCAWYAGAREKALNAARKAVEHDPGDERLRNNLKLIEAEMQKLKAIER